MWRRLRKRRSGPTVTLLAAKGRAAPRTTRGRRPARPSWLDGACARAGRQFAGPRSGAPASMAPRGLTNGAILSGWPAGGLDLAANPRRRISDGRSDAILHSPLVCIAQRESRTSTEHVAQSSAMNSWHGLITVIGQMPRRYRDLRERTERQQRRREEFIERLLEQQRERSLHSFKRPIAADTESIERPAPAEDSSVPPDPPPRV